MQITSHLPAIVKLISTHPVVSVVASTGSGKSVGIPAAIAATGARCFVTVPTRTAAISLAEYQTTLQKSSSPDIDTSKLVGYAAEGNVNYGPSTKIAYVTGGHARRKMLSYFSHGLVRPIDFCDVLMVDEVHSGSIDTTMIISLWIKASSLGVSVPRLVIASATPVPLTISPPPFVYTVEIPAFPIQYKYLDRDLDIDDSTGQLYIEASKIAASVHRDTPINTGHILIFAPGSTEIERIMSSLTETFRISTPDKIAIIIPAFGALKQEDIALIYKDTSPNERKIIIATNIAEMSITISDVGHVIDTMVEKRAETSQSGGFRLATQRISKDSAKQRAGRTGRTRPGVCYRLSTQQLFDSLEQHRPPEIQRVPIYEIVMELLDVGLSPETVILDIDPQRVTQAVLLLSRLGMVTNSNNSISVTPMGHFAPKLHISVRNASFLWNWITIGYPIFPGIVTAVLIDSYGPSYYWIPRRKPDMTPETYNSFVLDYKSKFFAKYIGYNDLETSLNMWTDLMRNTGGIHNSHSTQKTIINWSRLNSMNNKKIRELLMIVDQCVNAVKREQFDVQIGPFTTDGVIKAARPLLLSVYSDSTLIHSRDITYFNPSTREDYRLDNRDSINTLSSNPPKGVIALSTAEIKTQRGSFRVVGFAVDTEFDGLGRQITSKPPRSNQPSRGPRTTSRPRQFTPIVTESPNINDALDLLKELTLGLSDLNPIDTIQVTSPTVSIDREYTRFWYVNSMKDTIEQSLTAKQSYEALNSLERWLLGLANIKTPDIDPIFSLEKLDVSHTLTAKFLDELENKHIPGADIIVGTCIALAIQFLELPQFDPSPLPEFLDNTIIVGAYSRTLPVGRINLLHMDITNIGIMCLRYSCLLPRGQQWNIPLPVYHLMVNKYGVTVEGFASPINSQILAVNQKLHFCSLFPDTDHVFGSIGSFFDQDFDNLKILANPPFVLDLMDKMAVFLSDTFDRVTNFTCICVVPAWLDADYYTILNNHPYLKLSLELLSNNYYYVNSNDNDKIIPASFPSRLFLLSKGFPDIDINLLRDELLLIYKR